MVHDVSCGATAPPQQDAPWRQEPPLCESARFRPSAASWTRARVTSLRPQRRLAPPAALTLARLQKERQGPRPPGSLRATHLALHCSPAPQPQQAVPPGLRQRQRTSARRPWWHGWQKPPSKRASGTVAVCSGAVATSVAGLRTGMDREERCEYAYVLTWRKDQTRLLARFQCMRAVSRRKRCSTTRTPATGRNRIVAAHRHSPGLR